VLTCGTDFEVHVSSTNPRDLDLSGNTLSGHGDSALGSSVNPSVSDGNGSPDGQEVGETIGCYSLISVFFVRLYVWGNSVKYVYELENLMSDLLNVFSFPLYEWAVLPANVMIV
jgi:hypothetical protein